MFIILSYQLTPPQRVLELFLTHQQVVIEQYVNRIILSPKWLTSTNAKETTETRLSRYLNAPPLKVEIIKRTKLAESSLRTARLIPPPFRPSVRLPRGRGSCLLPSRPSRTSARKTRSMCLTDIGRFLLYVFRNCPHRFVNTCDSSPIGCARALFRSVANAVCQ